MPKAKLIDKEENEITTIIFDATGSPLSRQVNNEGITYQFEKREGETYVYKQYKP